jgi:hypothetical protein
MASSTASTLVAQAGCLDCIPKNMQLPVLIYIFSQIAGMSANASTLVKNAACLNCIPPAMQLPVLISLAYQILVAGGGGLVVAGGITFGHYGSNAPNFTPASGTGAAFDIDGQRPWYYYNGAWH